MFYPIYTGVKAAVTLEWKLAFKALSDRLDSDRPTCSRTSIFSWINGLNQYADKLLDNNIMTFTAATTN